MKRYTKPQSPRTSRSGFSLIELLIVIVIIGILMSLILPAIARTRYRTQIAAVTAEMTQLEMALATFNNRFGTYPPSSITLWGTQIGWDSNPVHKSVVRTIWPDFDFSTGGRGTGTHPWGTTNKVLTGDECLVFFLGGMPEYTAGNPVPSLRGFSKNARWPLAVAGENRDGPFFTEFKGERLVDAEVSPDAPDNVPSYLDSLPGQKTAMWYSVATNGRYANGDAAYYQADGKTAWKRDSFQIISPGADGEFGDIKKTATFKASYAETTDFATRDLERDNITNFSGGLLEQ